MAMCVMRRGRRRAVPVLLAGREPDDVAGPDLLDRAALALRPAAAGGDDQRLAERMRVPGGARAGLEGDAGAADARRVRRLEQRIDAHRAGEPLRRSLAGRLRAASLDFHAALLTAGVPLDGGFCQWELSASRSTRD